MAVRHAAGIVVAGTEKVRRVGGIVLSLHFGIKEYPDLGIYRLFDIGRIAVPYDARRRKLRKFVERRVYGLPAGMCRLSRRNGPPASLPAVVKPRMVWSSSFPSTFMSYPPP